MEDLMEEDFGIVTMPQLSQELHQIFQILQVGLTLQVIEEQK